MLQASEGETDEKQEKDGTRTKKFRFSRFSQLADLPCCGLMFLRGLQLRFDSFREILDLLPLLRNFSDRHNYWSSLRRFGQLADMQLYVSAFWG